MSEMGLQVAKSSKARLNPEIQYFSRILAYLYSVIPGIFYVFCGQ